jgi:DNA helicase HerA-like ATPase
MGFTLPNGENRTVVMGATGTGKTVLAAYLLARSNFNLRPWVILDYKGEILFDEVGMPPLIELKLGRLPKKKGIYICSPNPGDDEGVEDMLWKIWDHENIGVFVDEASLLPKKNAFKAILRQGRSKRVPVIACTQRPVDVDREVFTEASYMAIFRQQDERDYKIIQGFTQKSNIRETLPPHHSYWYDVAKNSMTVLQPCPSPSKVAELIRDRAPRRWSLI